MKSLVLFVQDLPTQFDVPLYFKIHDETNIQIAVFYTQVSKMGSTVDPEISRAPQWDTLEDKKYPIHFEQSFIRLWLTIVRFRPDHVVISGWYPRSHAFLALLLRLSGISVGVRTDNTLEHTVMQGCKGFVKKRVMSLWLSLYNTWHPVGVKAYDYLKSISHVQRPAFYFPYAVDVDWFAQESFKYRVNLADIRKQLGFASDDFVVIGVMKWNEREDPLTLVDAVFLAMQKIPKIKLLLIGDGPLRAEIHSRESMFESKMVLPGYVKYSALPLYYSISDIFVHPALSEPYGVSVHEAMASGLPTLVSDKVGSAADLLFENVTGNIFPVRDVLRLSDLIVSWAIRVDLKELRDIIKHNADRRSYNFSISQIKMCLEKRSDVLGKK